MASSGGLGASPGASKTYLLLSPLQTTNWKQSTTWLCLDRGFTYLDLAAAVIQAAHDDDKDAAGNMWRVHSVRLDQDQSTLRIQFDIWAWGAFQVLPFKKTMQIES